MEPINYAISRVAVFVQARGVKKNKRRKNNQSVSSRAHVARSIVFARTNMNKRDKYLSSHESITFTSGIAFSRMRFYINDCLCLRRNIFLTPPRLWLIRKSDCLYTLETPGVFFLKMVFFDIKILDQSSYLRTWRICILSIIIYY